jgi:hypothetical protein
VRRWLKIVALLIGTVAIHAPLSSSVAPAESGACTSSCRAQYNQCRISTKGSSSCDAQFAACMRSCIQTRGH